MTNSEMLVLRIPAQLKSRLKLAARRERKSMSTYVKERIEAELRKGKTGGERPTQAAREALSRFIGAGRSPKKYRLTNEEIDRIVYGI